VVDLNTFIVSVFCLIDDRLKGRHRSYRSRGPAPKLSDSEVITMEIVAEFLGIDTDKGIYTYFKRHYSAWFPKLCEVHRTTFTRQAANLWKVKEILWQHIVEEEFAPHEEQETPPLMVIDSFPIPVCKKSRSYRCKVMRELSERGRDTNLGKFLGMRAHIVVMWPGIIVRANVCGADTHELHLAERLLEGMGRGWVLADRNYWSPLVREQLSDYEGGPTLLARFKLNNETEKQRGLVWPRWLSKKRQKIESIFSQLVERYKMKVVRSRDTWHFSSRFIRKILSHTMAVVFCRREGIPQTRFWELLTD
jgi:Transposase DDE domain